MRQLKVQQIVLETHQPIVFSEDDVYINFDKWKSGEAHALLLTGLSGSGKSTLGAKLAEKYHCHYVEMDVIGFKITGQHPQNANWKYIKENDILLYKYMKDKNINPGFMLDINLSNYKFKKQWETRQIKYIDWLIYEQKERCIIGGGAVGFYLRNHKEACKLPIIFKGTSLFKSLYRRLVIRSKKTLIEQLPLLPLIFKQYCDMMREVDSARRNAMINNNYEYRSENI